MLRADRDERVHRPRQRVAAALHDRARKLAALREAEQVEAAAQLFERFELGADGGDLVFFCECVSASTTGGGGRSKRQNTRCTWSLTLP